MSIVFMREKAGGGLPSPHIYKKLSKHIKMEHT